MIPAALAILILAAAPPLGTAPTWEKNEVKSLFLRAEAAGNAPDMNAELARVIGAAYRLQAIQNESTDAFARRLTKRREPGHPDVKQGSWVTAATRQFYRDLAARADTLARVEIDRNDRMFFEMKSSQAKAAVEELGKILLTKVEGAKGFMSPLPIGTGQDGNKFGCEAIVRNDKIEVNNLERVTFIDNAPKLDAARTGSGSLKELAASMKEWNLRADMMGQIDPLMKKGSHLLRIFAPAAAPAIYLNELLRAAKETSMKKVFVMVTDKADGKLKEIVLVTEAPVVKVKLKKPEIFVDVRCKDGEPIQICVDRMVELNTQGSLVFKVD